MNRTDSGGPVPVLDVPGTALYYDSAGDGFRWYSQYGMPATAWLDCSPHAEVPAAITRSRC